MLVKEGLFKPKCPEDSWLKKVPDCMKHINRRIHSTTKFAPDLLFYGIDYNVALKDDEQRTFQFLYCFIFSISLD